MEAVQKHQLSKLHGKGILKRKYIFIEIACWLFAYGIFTFYLNQRLQDFIYAASIATSAFLFFAVIVYTYSFWLYPRYFKKKQKLFFALIALLFLTAVSFARLFTELAFFKTVFSGNT